MDLPELSNMTEVTKKEKREEDSGFVANIKNLWRTINYDMDNQAVDEANENLRQVGEEKKDLDLIDEYVKLINKRDSIKNKLETSKYTNVKE
jgi:hypothetical protein